MLADRGYVPSRRRASLAARVVAVSLLAASATSLPGAPARSDDDARVEPGSALATAQVLSAKITYGGFSLPLAVAASGASYKDSSANATSQGIVAGSVTGAAAGGGSCDAGGAAPTALAAPPLAPIEASTTDDASSHKTTGALPIGAGEVDARRSPLSASSTTSAIAVAVPGVLKVAGSSTASVSYEEGTARIASAGVAVDVVLGAGLVKLSGLTWDVRRRGAASTEVEGSFAVAAIAVGGVVFKIGTADQLKAAVTAANAALKLLGLAIDVPELGQSENLASVPPLNIRVFGSAALAAVIRPLMQLKAPVQDAVAGLLAGDQCALAQLSLLVGTSLLIGDIVLAALSGEGEIDLGVGGVQVATVPPPAYQDPFGDGTDSGPSGKPTVDPVSTEGQAPGSPVAPVAAAPVVAAPPVGTDVPVVTAPVSGRIGCISANPADHRPCTRGVGGRTAALLLLGALALFAADVYQSRRRRPIVRRSPR